jgi:hypothetical protein
MAVATPAPTRGRNRHVILASGTQPVPLVFRTGRGPRPPVGPTAGLAAARRDPGSRSANRDQLDPGRRALPGVPPLLHHRGRRRKAVGLGRCPTAARGAQAPVGRDEPAGGRHRRHPDAPVRATGPGSRHSSQPHTRPSRQPVRLRPRVGGARVAGRSPTLGRVGLAAVGQTLRPPQGPAQHRPVASTGVPDQVGVGCRVDPLGGLLAEVPW